MQQLQGKFISLFTTWMAEWLSYRTCIPPIMCWYFTHLGGMSSGVRARDTAEKPLRYKSSDLQLQARVQTPLSDNILTDRNLHSFHNVDHKTNESYGPKSWNTLIKYFKGTKEEIARYFNNIFNCKYGHFHYSYKAAIIKNILYHYAFSNIYS